MSERHAAGQPWEEFLQHLDEEHWGSRNPAFLPADEPPPEEEFEPTAEGIAYVLAMDLADAKVPVNMVERILDRVLADVKARNA